MRVGVLALQGAFIEHEQMLQHIGVEAFEIRQLKDFQQPIDRLIIPGGESTTLRKLLKDTGLFTPIRERILDIRSNDEYLSKVVRQGAEKARETAAKTLKDVREIMGIRKF